MDALFLDVPTPTDGRKLKRIPLNEQNFERREFQELWGRINHKTVYQVDFDSGELITKCIQVLDKALTVPVMQYVVQKGVQLASLEAEQLEAGDAFKVTTTKVEASTLSATSTVRYDLLGGDRRQDPAHPPDLRGDPDRREPGDVREVHAEPRAVHHRVLTALTLPHTLGPIGLPG